MPQIVKNSTTLNQDSYEMVTFRACAFQKVTGVSFANCIFEQCLLDNSEVKNCTFEHCSFAKSSGNMSKFIDSSFLAVSFTDCSFVGADFTKLKSLLPITFSATRSNFTYATFASVKIQAQFCHCNIKDADFTETLLKKSSFLFCNLEKTIFTRSDVSECDFRGAKNYFLDISSVNLKNAIFSQPDVMNLLDSIPVKVADAPEEEEML
jgi:uncharacterized protein YjbI with pentapeptide repeats